MTAPLTRAVSTIRLRWWQEIGVVLALYFVYSFVRNLTGSAAVSDDVARTNAYRLIEWERSLGMFHEESVQEIFLGSRPFIWVWNVFYATAHFAVTVGTLLWLFFRRPERYPRWRNCLVVTTVLALIGFALFPLMPPRMLPELGFVDTLKTVGGLWSFEEGPIHKVSNQYAAMPSLHFGWALWCGIVLYRLGRTWLGRWLGGAYPVLTLFAIVITGNHFVLDAVGGALILLIGVLAADWFENRARRPPDELVA